MQPSSKQVTIDAQGNANCDSDRPVTVNEVAETEITYTYSVEWRVSSSLSRGLLNVVLFDEMGYSMG